MQNYVMSEGRRNQFWVALTAAAFVLVAAVLTSLVVHAKETPLRLGSQGAGKAERAGRRRRAEGIFW